MPKLKINIKEGLEMDIAEQKSIMAPYLHNVWLVILVTLGFIWKEQYILAASCFFLYLGFVIVIYFYNLVEHPDKLQSETYRLKKNKTKEKEK
jgi:hypothetical protein